MSSPDASFSDLAAAMIRAAAAGVLDTEDAAIADAPDGIHRHRTRVRRLRSILAALRPYLDEAAAQRLRVSFREWGTQLGTVRDAEVMAADAAEALERAGIADEEIRQRLVEEPRSEHARRHARLLEVRNLPRAGSRMSDLRAFALEPRLGDPGEDTEKVLAGMLRHEARRVRRAAKRADGTLDRYHDLRKAGRRLRYIAEAVREVGPGSLAAVAQELGEAGSHLHDVLGTHRDALALAERVARTRVRAARAGESIDAYDRLLADAEERAESRLRKTDAAVARVRAASDHLL